MLSFKTDSSGEAAASGFDGCFGTGGCANARQLDSRVNFTSLDDLDHTDHLAHQTSLLERQHVNFCQTEQAKGRQRDFSVVLERR